MRKSKKSEKLDINIRLSLTPQQKEALNRAVEEKGYMRGITSDSAFARVIFIEYLIENGYLEKPVLKKIEKLE